MQKMCMIAFFHTGNQQTTHLDIRNTKNTMQHSNYKITVSYDGRNFFGWQRHGDKPTIQYALEQALAGVVGSPCTIKGSGRTDRGAHANGQVISVELATKLQADELKKALNDTLQTEVRIVEVKEVEPSFDACDSATGKRYRYIIWNDSKVPEEHDGRVWHVKTPLDVEAMEAACSVFVGTHDFSSFATKPNFKQKSTTRTITSVEMKHDLPHITIDMCADGFLYKMVRNIVRSLVKVGEGRYSRKDLIRILEAKDRKAAPGTAPASGLYLDQVFYPEESIQK